MRIAIDAMGGDHAPREIVKGAVSAAAAFGDVRKIILIGDEAAVRRELERCGPVPEKIEVRHASEVVAMDEAPAQAVRRKKDSSISRAMDLVKQGEADAVLSAGNTGALVVAATLKLRTLAGVDRPALAAVMPTRGRPVIVIDAGGNTDCPPEQLVQFAVMGSVYSSMVLGQARPVVGLLSVGGEEVKGNEVTRAAFGLLSAAHLNFRGNVEGNDMFRGETDVVVCDGFVGNVVLKTSESIARTIGHWMRDEFRRGPARMLGALLLSGALRSMKRRMDPESYGGAPLLGVNGVCIKVHGSSSSQAVYHAIRVADVTVHQRLNEQMVAEIAKLGQTR